MRYSVITLPHGRWGLRDGRTGAGVEFVSCRDEAHARVLCDRHNAAYARLLEHATDFREVVGREVG